jgi:hypothetical protein
MGQWLHPYYIIQAGIILSYAAVRTYLPSDALQEPSTWTGLTRVRVCSLAAAKKAARRRHVPQHNFSCDEQEFEIMGLVGLALFSKARKAATSVEIVEKFLLFSKTGVVALTYYIDARIAAGYCAVFAGMITQM